MIKIIIKKKSSKSRTGVVSDVVIGIQVSYFYGRLHVFIPLFPVVGIVEYVEQGVGIHVLEDCLYFDHFKVAVRGRLGPHLQSGFALINDA